MISYIIPVYNSEKTIKKCILSVLAQKYIKEIIIINDGSNDNTRSVLKEYSTHDYIRVINTSNRGVSSARNLGIKLSRGKYIRFVDADDTLPVNSSELLILSSGDLCDLVVGASDIFTNDGIYKRKHKLNINELISVNDYINYILYNADSLGVGDKLFLREVIINNGIYFDKNI
ncbi:glycosyltransferase family 2 protein, partial [Rosenbergiella australiborealis]|uniref:glycosyltransferase family 2 protein n=1 Tax=Rosenbergiella australiborealis TaxID=1544696 RepID=UPI001F4EDDBE